MTKAKNKLNNKILYVINNYDDYNELLLQINKYKIGKKNISKELKEMSEKDRYLNKNRYDKSISLILRWVHNFPVMKHMDRKLFNKDWEIYK